MDTIRKSKKVQRSLFTKSLTNFHEKCDDQESSYQEQMIALQLLESRFFELESVNTSFINCMLETDASEEEIEQEIESHDVYKMKFLRAKSRMIVSGKPPFENSLKKISNQNEKPFKKPTLEIPKFNGSIGGWLHFWSHFRKIHDNTDISNEDKLDFLKFAMEKGSKAENVVEGYPTTSDNYDKAIDSLKNRFGREDLLIEYYTRELLALALQNASLSKGKKISLSCIYDKISAHIRALETLGVTTNNCATMLYPLVESSLPEDILRIWQRSMNCNEENSDKEPSGNRLSKLLKFLQSEVENEERIDMAMNGFNVKSLREKSEKVNVLKEKIELKEPPTASVLLQREGKHKKCIFCKGEHENGECEKAKQMPVDTRKNLIKESNCCFKCLKRGHHSKDCRVKIICGWCKQRHSILFCPSLHGGNSNNARCNAKGNTDIASTSTNNTSTSTKEQNLANFSSVPQVYLQTLRVILYSDSHETVVRAVVDSGSQRSYIRSKVAEAMGYLAIGYKEITHLLFGGVNSKNEKHNIYKARIKSLTNDYACNFEVMDQNIICSDIPSIKDSVCFDELKNNNIVLSDLLLEINDFGYPIDLLIGADVAGKLMTGKKFDLSNGLTAIETKLGWTIMGKVTDTDSTESFAMTTLSLFLSSSNISDLWSLDTLGIKDPIEKINQTHKDEKVRENFLKTVILNNENRYCVDLPWIEDHAPLPDNYSLVKVRLDTLVRRLHKDGLYKEYERVFNEWLLEGIIEIVPDDELKYFGHYLPHHQVVKAESSTTKIRPVFDASAKQQGYPSLNQCLEKGPNLIELIPAALLRFREHEIGVIADVRKAFLQIEINCKDRDFLRFLWFFNGKIQVFRHKRVVFGLKCSPFLLGAVFGYHLSNLLNNSSSSTHTMRWSENTVRKLKKSFYVDNCTTSVRTPEELEVFISEAKEVMAAGCFDLRGWEHTRDSSDCASTIVLGLVFNKLRDTISIKQVVVEHNILETVTKRVILSVAQKLFDPIGLTCPVTLLPKLLLKKVWKLKTSWDAPVDTEICEEIRNWLDELKFLNSIEIPRWFGKGNFSIHTFCDASKLAYATVTFLRVESVAGVEIRFLGAKTRVAPEKTTIPRLELLAASIGSRLTQVIVESLGYNNVPIFYWSDSTTVLAWINRDLQWGTFVWNRVREIRSLTASGVWKYVPGELNPADLPSRGCNAKELASSLWWEGPSWLRDAETDWPNITYRVNENEIKQELKKSAQISLIAAQDDGMNNIITKFSSYHKLIRFFAIMLRFKNYKLNRMNKIGNRLTYSELYKTELKFLAHLQSIMFLPKKDPKLCSLQVCKDSDGVLRLKTKITERKDSFSFLYPIILDRRNEAVTLLIRETHENMCHAGVQFVMCQLREKYWIFSMRKAVRSVITKCVICNKHDAKNLRINSPPLPVDRVKEASVFEVIGVDYAGPVFLRGQLKGWICLFTCAVYRAVHLELVSSLSTNDFLSCLKRFIARRGRPSIIYSDNGTNFVGADNSFKKLNWDIITKFSSAKQIDWRFNPPTASWWGGWWERLIGLLKNILRKVLGKSCLTYEEMYTVLCDCESVLNSRPLTYLSEDPDDLKALTPAMFLQEIRHAESPDLDILNKINLVQRFKRKQEIMEHLRKRFRREYLSQLIHRGNTKESRQLRLGDIVLIGDDSHKRLEWPLARVEELIKGKDGKIRVVILKTKDGKFKRPIQRVYPLEVSRDDVLVTKFHEVCENTCGTNNVSHLDFKDQTISPVCEENYVDNVVRTRSGRIVKRPNSYS